MPVLALGVSYRRAPAELLERVAIPDDKQPKAYQRLAGMEAVRESVILSTCNRVEVYADVAGFHQGFQDLRRFFSETTDVPVEELDGPLDSHYENDAAEQLFSAAAGLDSMVLGEPQILAHVRAAYRRAETEGATGPELEALFQRAVRAGRRVRGETAIGSSPGAFIDAGLALAEQHLDSVRGRLALVVGAGEMGALAVSELLDHDLGDVLVVSGWGGAAAAPIGAPEVRHASLDELPRGLAAADVVISATESTGVVLSAETVARATADHDRKLFVLDLGVPRNVDPRVAELPRVRLAGIDDVAPVVKERRGDVTQQVELARGIVRAEVENFAQARRARRLAPLIRALHARGEAIRAEEVRRMAGRLGGMLDRDRDAVEALTRRIVARLLHEPTVKLKELAGGGPTDSVARALADLFGLEPEG